MNVNAGKKTHANTNSPFEYNNAKFKPLQKKVASKRGLQQQQQQKNRRLFNNGSTPQLCTDSMVKWP